MSQSSVSFDMKTDIVVIGSGIGGLSCGALLARYGFDVTVCESHSIGGGAAHSFERNGFKFDSGLSLYSGLSYSPSANPLKQVLDAIGEKVPSVTYNTWGCCLPEGDFDTSVGADQFCEVLAKLRGEPTNAICAAIAVPAGPAIRAGFGFFPGSGTPLPGLMCCGDSTFPGIGLPAVAASGMIAANTLAPLQKHLEMLADIDFLPQMKHR